MKYLQRYSAALLASVFLVVPWRQAQRLTNYSITGNGGTVTVGTSGSNSTNNSGGIVTTSDTWTNYYNGYPITETIPTYKIYQPKVITNSSATTISPCLEMVLSSSTTSYWGAYELEQSFQNTWNELSLTYPACRFKKSGSSSNTSISPGQLITTFWQDTVRNRLSIPQFSVPPGFALVGMTSYLTSTCQTNQTFFDDTPLGKATIQASGELWVKWNSMDTWLGPYDSCGTPWPNGIITHVYQKSQLATVELKETWTANWSLAGSTGTLSGLQTSPHSQKLPVHAVSSEIFS